MKEVRQDILVWCDIETMGLDATSPIIELGFRITDLDVNLIAKKSWTVWEPSTYEQVWEESPEVVKQMHTSNKLVAEAYARGCSREVVEQAAINWIVTGEYDGQPLAGSSVHTDRMWIAAQMPDLLKCFHYRNIDTSTIKELCRRLNPRVYDHLPTKNEQHRVDPDLEESCMEYKHYLDNFLWDGRE